MSETLVNHVWNTRWSADRGDYILVTIGCVGYASEVCVKKGDIRGMFFERVADGQQLAFGFGPVMSADRYLPQGLVQHIISGMATTQFEVSR